MSKQIITKYAGAFARQAVTIAGDADACIVSIVDREKGTEEVIFTGKRFDPEKYKERGGLEDERRLMLDQLNRKIPEKQLNTGRFFCERYQQSYSIDYLPLRREACGPDCVFPKCEFHR